MNRQLLAIIFCTAILPTTAAFGQSTSPTGSQKFTVHVPPAISITAPEAVAITHDQTDLEQQFTPQLWAVRGNSTRGVTVSLSAPPFINISDARQKRNVRLILGLGGIQGAATWNMPQPSASTDYANNVNTATVQLKSNGVGRANFFVNVAFLTNGFGTFSSGDYVTTVTGTVTEN